MARGARDTVNLRAVARIGSADPAPERNAGEIEVPAVRRTSCRLRVDFVPETPGFVSLRSPLSTDSVPPSWLFGQNPSHLLAVSAHDRIGSGRSSPTKNVRNLNEYDQSCPNHRPEKRAMRILPAHAVISPSFPCYRCEVSLFWNSATNGCEVSKREHFQGKMRVQRRASRLCIRVNLHITGNIRWRPVRHRLRYAPFSFGFPVLSAGRSPRFAVDINGSG